MSNLSAAYISKNTDLGGNASVIYRAWFEIAGVGKDGLTLALKVMDPAGNLVSLTENTHWKQYARANVQGGYEVAILIPGKLDTLGQYTVEIDSQDPGALKLVGQLTMNRIYGKITDAAPTSTSFTTDLPSSTNNFYVGGFFSMRSGSLVGSGPQRVLSYAGSTKTPTIEALPVAPATGDIFYLIRD